MSRTSTDPLATRSAAFFAVCDIAVKEKLQYAKRRLVALGSVQGDPVFMRRINGWFTIFWIAMIPVSYSLGWLQSVTYVSALSLWALVSGHWATWQAARVEVTQQREAEEREQNPVEERIIEKLVETTDVIVTVEP